VSNTLKNVEILVKGNQYSVSQLGIDLIKQNDYKDSNDPVVEAVVITRRMSGLIETETCLTKRDTMAKFAEHLNIRSNFESANENAMLAYEDEDDEM
jgi:hypothetical protein